LILLLFLLCSVFSYSAADLAILEGGCDGEVGNWIGPVGAKTSRLLFYLFGLVVYPALMLFSLSVIRGYFPYPLERKGYVGAFLFVLLGMTIWAGLYPDENDTLLLKMAELGLGRYAPDSAPSSLSGGVIGQVLAAPPVRGEFEAGFIRRYVGEIGTLIVAFALMIPGILLMIYEDCRGIVDVIRRKRANMPKAAEPAARSKDQPAPAEEPPFEPDEPMASSVPETSAAPAAEPTFFQRLFGGSRKPEPVAEEEDLPVRPPAHEPVGAPGRVSDPDGLDDDDYVVRPPRPDSGSEAAASAPAPAPAAMTRTGHLTLPVMEEHPEPETLPSLDSRPASAASPAAKPVSTPVGVMPVIQQFADKRERPAVSHGTSASEPAEPVGKYELPQVSMLDYHDDAKSEDRDYLEKGRERLQATLDSFSVAGHVENIIVGPRVTRYEVVLDEGVEVSKITRISNNIAMTMEAQSVRILAPIPGRNAVGIEVPNKVSSIVYIRAVMESPEWSECTKPIPIVLGRDVEGKAMVTDLAKAPHLLIAGSTGSGKSVCMNTLIMSLLFKFSPDELRLILVDPKVVEMEAYSKIPHLITPVVNDPKKVPLALRWGVNEMERRYRVFAKVHAKDLKTFNSRPKDPEPVLDEEGAVIPQKLPFLIIIIDELADIMMTEAKKDVETSICRIAQKGRASGVHLVIATQTPRKDIITGIIKANLPVKIAFKVGTNMDSRVILDQGGAEKLLGMGDLLFMPPGASNLERIQMTLVTDDEIMRIVNFVSKQRPQHFNDEVLAEDAEIIEGGNDAVVGRAAGGMDENPEFGEGEDYDTFSSEVIDSVAAKYLQPGDSPLLRQALELVINERQASISFFQRRLGIGYNKSAELVDQLEQRNIVSKPLGGGQKRDILILDGLEVSE